MIAPVRVLLDTHVLLWLVSAPHRVAAPTREVLTDPRTQVVVSAASAWEIAVKTRSGRLDGDVLLAAWTDIVADMPADEIPIGAE